MGFPEGRPPSDKVHQSLKSCEPQLWIVLALLVSPLYWLLVAQATVGLAVAKSWSPQLQIHGQPKTKMSWGENEPLLYGPQDYDYMGLGISGSWAIVSHALSPHRDSGQGLGRILVFWKLRGHWLALTVSLTESRISWETGLWGITLVTLIEAVRPVDCRWHLAGVLDYNIKEAEQQHTFIMPCFLNVMWTTPSSSPCLAFSTTVDCTLELQAEETLSLLGWELLF